MAEFTTTLETSLLPEDNKFNREYGADGEYIITLTNFKQALTESSNVAMAVINYFCPIF